MIIQCDTVYATRDRNFVKESQKLETCGTGGGQKKTYTGLTRVYTAKLKCKLLKCDLLCSYRTNVAPGQRVTYCGKESNSKNKITLVTTTVTIIIKLLLMSDLYILLTLHIFPLPLHR
jgi:hypothetical protein